MNGVNISNIEITDFYEIYDFDCKKYIHVSGYAYCAGESVTDDPNEIYREVEYCGFDLPLTDYLARGFSYSDASSEAGQYIADMTERDVYDYIEEMTSGRSRVDLGSLTMDTPCGDYYGVICK